MTPSPITHCPDPSRWLQRLYDRSVIDEATGCRIWLGRRDERPGNGMRGYGKFTVSIDGRKRTTGAHRAMWLAAVGDIAPGLQIDHLCHRPACINVAHLEVVTPRENMRRAVRDGLGVGMRRGSTGVHECGKHGRSDGYDHRAPDGYVRWVCRICSKGNIARWKSRQRARSSAA